MWVVDAATPVYAAFASMCVAPQAANDSVVAWMICDFPAPSSPYRTLCGGEESLHLATSWEDAN